MAGQKPIVKIKGGNNVSLAIWENQIEIKGKTVAKLTATLQRRYVDKSGNWQTSYSFGKAELPDAIFCMKKAFEKMIEIKNDENNDNIEEETVM